MEKAQRSFTANGIIAEYNPFHNGHKYHLEDARRQTGAQMTVVAMGGNFMQRGIPALIDKFKRAEMALKNGADLVLELPSCYSASSAEYFASGAVALLDKLGVVDYLCFGSEFGNIHVLTNLADILLEESDTYVNLLHENLRSGLSYPLARTNALMQYKPELNEYHDVLSFPNNILGIEYIKALKRRESSMQPVTTRRTSSDYHARSLSVHQSSALAIRQAVYNKSDIGLLADQLPPSAYEILRTELEQREPLQLNDFSDALYHKLIMESDQGYTRYLDVSSDLSDRIRNNIGCFTNISDFCNLIKTKDMTYNRISRCMLHILLNMEKDIIEKYQKNDYIPYARVLGFRRDAQSLLTAIKANSSIPLITKLADAERILDGEGMEMLRRELLINSVYTGAFAKKNGLTAESEYSIPLVIV